MSDTLKVLGQATPSATTRTTLYTVPAATSTVISSIVVCNTNATAVTFRVEAAVAGAAAATKQYLYYELPLSGYNTFTATLGITLAATDIIAVYASGTGVAFQVFGTEVS